MLTAETDNLFTTNTTSIHAQHYLHNLEGDNIFIDKWKKWFKSKNGTTIYVVPLYSYIHKLIPKTLSKVSRF